jgi:hypothetical protein
MRVESRNLCILSIRHVEWMICWIKLKPEYGICRSTYDGEDAIWNMSRAKMQLQRRIHLNLHIVPRICFQPVMKVCEMRSYEQAFLTSTYIRDTGMYWTDLRETNWEFAFSNGDRPPFTNWGANEPGWWRIFRFSYVMSRL